MKGKIKVRFQLVEQKVSASKLAEMSAYTRYERGGTPLDAADGVEAIGALYVKKSAQQLAFGELPHEFIVTIEAA